MAALLIMFNVGLPIVVASCPMMRTSADRGPCCAEASPLGSVHLRGVMSTSCCKTILAAERNTNEYLQVSVFTGSIQQPAALAPVQDTPRVFAGHSTFCRSHAPPIRGGGDLPVLLSTLII